MKKFEALVNFTGCLFINIDANSKEEAKEIFLKNIGNNKNLRDEPYFTLENLKLDTPVPMVLDEFSISIPEKLTEEDIEYWEDFDIWEIDENGDYVDMK